MTPFLPVIDAGPLRISPSIAPLFDLLGAIEKNGPSPLFGAICTEGCGRFGDVEVAVHGMSVGYSVARLSIPAAFGINGEEVSPASIDGSTST